MIPAFIGLSGGIVTILLINVISKNQRLILYSLVLCGIGFLYVGFTWTDLNQLIITCIQAFVFLLLAYYGLAKNTYILAAGYFLHGIWDLFYKFLSTDKLIPPDYDIFCLTIDFVIGAYILVFRRQLISQK